MKKQLKGLLIVIEGIDGSGKSSLARSLSLKIAGKGKDVLQTKEPGGTSVGLQLRELLVGKERKLTNKAEYLLFATDHAQHIQEVVIPHLYKGGIVVSDRMSDSCFAYQGYGRNIDTELITTINDWIMQNVTVDITLYVRIPVHIAIERINARGAATVFEQEAFLERVTQGFETLYKNRSNVIVIDGAQSAETVLNVAYQALQERFAEHDL